MVKIYLAGAEAFSDIMKNRGFNALMNYYYIKDNKKVVGHDFLSNGEFASLFLDSGAFTAWTKKVTISIEEYCNFVKKFSCSFYSVLDVIGDAEGILQNQKKMEELGTSPVPCFHYNDDMKYLDYYCKNYEFISLGGMVGQSTKDLRIWLDAIFLKYPNKKFHGFRLTRKSLIERYPWYSVDSSSWIQTNMTKRIYSAEWDEFLYLGNNISCYTQIIQNPGNKKWIDKMIKYGINPETLFTSYKDSLILNAYGFIELSQKKNSSIHQQQTLF